MCVKQGTIKWIDLIGRALLLICFSVLCWTISRTNGNYDRTFENKYRITAIEANRFTLEDGQNHLIAITQNRSSIDETARNIVEIKQTLKELLTAVHKNTGTK